jgi:predicted nucleic acid-binding protein
LKKYALDTNLYIRAITDPGAAAELRSFYSTFAPGTYMSSVVLHELLVGATSLARGRQIREAVAEPFRRTRRVLTPSADAWETAADAIAAMARREKRELRSLPKSLINDFLIAASCRENGVVLVTHNTADFEAIKRYIKVQFTAPWPD